MTTAASEQTATSFALHPETSDGSPVLAALSPGAEDDADFQARAARVRDLSGKAEPWLLRPLRLEHRGRSECLLMEAPLGPSLATLMNATRPDPGEVLRLGLRLAEAIDGLHEARLHHGRLSPHSVFFRPVDGRLQVALFPESLQRRPGTQGHFADCPLDQLAFQAPEQTGRLSRGADRRADFFALGAILHFLVEGRPPFAALDRMELLHQIIATPAPVAALAPPGLRRIIERLLSKAPEDRYQTAWGILQDLRLCLRRAESGDTSEFPLGEADVQANFAFPSGLFGRENDLAVLRAMAARRVDGSDHAASLILVGGYSGTGKSSLVAAYLDEARRDGAVTIGGKHDQLQTLPYKAIIEALRGFVQQSLAAAPEIRAAWLARLQARVGAGLDALVTFVPELALVVGDQITPDRIDPGEREERFQQAMRGLFETLGTPQAPAILFLDDLHWADAATFKVIEDLATASEARHLTIIGAYRSNEITSNHPLTAMSRRLGESGLPRRALEVAPLGFEAVAQIIQATLSTGRDRVLDLVRPLLGKSAGNPFHLRQLLATLHENGDISFDRKAGQWTWQIERIQMRMVDADIARLLAERIDRLSPDTRETLALAACFGAEFTPDMLSILDNWPGERRNRALAEAEFEGLILRNPAANLAEAWLFSHDRVQEAAYAHLDPAEAKARHARIGDWLMRQITAPARDPRLFTALDHVILAIDLVRDPVVGRRLAALTLAAARKAKSVAAYDQALRYLSAVASLPRSVTGTDWEADFDLAFALETEHLEARFLGEGWDRAKPQFDVLIARARGREQRALVHHLVSSLFTIQVDFPRALQHGIEGARLLGVDIAGPYGPKIGMTLMATLLRQPRPHQFDFATLPDMADPRRAMAMDLLMTVATPAFLANTEMFVLLALRMYQLTMRHGVTEGAASAISNYAIVIYIAFGSVDRAYAIQQRLEEMLARRDVPDRVRGRVIYSRAMVLDWYKEPHDRILDKLEAGLELSRLAADREYIGYYHFGRLRYLFAKGVALADMKGPLEQAERVAGQLRHDTLSGLCTTYRRVMGLATDPQQPLWSTAEDAYEKTLLNEPNQGSFYAAMFLLAVIEEDYALAETMRRRLHGLANYVRTGPDFGEILLLSVILARSIAGTLPAVIARKVRKTGRGAEKKLRWLVTSYPTNTRHLGAILDAMESERLQGARLAATAWDAALQVCRDAGQLQYAALAADLAARGAAREGLESERNRRLRAAMDHYEAWGSARRVAQIAALLPREVENAPASGVSVDAGTIAKAAHAIFESLDFGTLVQQLLTLALKNAGADRGALYLMQDGKPQLVAEGKIDAGRLSIVDYAPPRPIADLDAADYPVTIIGAVAANGRAVLIDDAALPGEFSASHYFAGRASRSVMCLPVMRLGVVEAILHVENTLSPQVFTSDRRDVLETLVGLAAISLVNARLYARQSEALRLERHAGEELERLSRLKDEFLANTSHELRTPLNGIIGLAESLAEGTKGPLPKAAIESLNMVVESGRRLEHLVSDILDLAGLRVGGIELRAVPVDLRAVAAHAASLLDGKARGAGVTIEITISEALTVLADEDRLLQIFLNLLDNAIKFAPGGPVTIAAQAVDGRVEVVVQDAGPGIAAVDRSRIFQSFEQLDASLSRIQGGAGLGLAIVQHLVSLHGGLIRVEDGNGGGARFVFDLGSSATPPAPREAPVDRGPALTQTFAAPHAAQPAERSFQVADPDRNGVVLIVDDDAANRQVLENHLGLAGYLVVAASSGPEALELLQHGRQPDVVLLDLMMPHMSGYEVCAKIRETRSAAKLPVIMLTARNRAKDLTQAFDAGANDHIAKPFVKEELLARVRSHAELSRMNRAYERFVPVEFLQFLKRDRIIDIELGDNARHDMTVMFTDIRKFSGMTERLPPDEGFDLLVDYFAAISPAIYDHGGFLNNYTGDGIMALFPGTPDSALQAAIAVQQAVARFNQTRLSRSRPVIETGIGLHRGPVTLGILGHEDRRTANVVSDAVNLASRIENLTGLYGIRIAASRDFLDSLAEPGRFAIRELDLLRVQGKDQIVTVCEVFDGDDSAAFDAKLASLPTYRTALAAFRAARFDEAAELFATLARNDPGDGPATRFLAKCRDYAHNGPPPDWDTGQRINKVPT